MNRYFNASLSDFDEKQIEPVLTWINGDMREVLFVTGSSGCGKTHLIYAMYNKIRKQGGLCALATFSDIALELKESFNKGYMSEFDVIKKYRKNMTGIFDDLASNRPTDYVAESIYAIINHRYTEAIPSVYTSNLSISQIADIYGDRIASRLASGTVFNLQGKDRRLKK